MTHVLDASALLALIFEERGADRVDAVLIDRPMIATVNLGEVAHRLTLVGRQREAIARLVNRYPITNIDVDYDLALEAGFVAAFAKPYGLSFADRICMMLAKRFDLPALTSDRRMADAADALGVKVELIR